MKLLKPILQIFVAFCAVVRRKTLEGLKARDDIWFAASIDEGMNNHWAWFHILKHSANHMGQIALVKSRLPR